MIKKWHWAIGTIGILMILIILPGTGLLHGERTISNTYFIPAGTFHPFSIIPPGTGNPLMSSWRSNTIANESTVLSGGTAMAIAVKTDEISTPYPEAKDLFIKGLTLSTQYARYNESLEYFDKALTIDPNFTEAWYAKGVAFHNMNRYDEAVICYDRALAIDPSDTFVQSLKAVTLKDKSRIEEIKNSG